MVEKLKEAIIGDLKQELREFKREVRGTLEGFRIAIEGMKTALEITNKRLDS